jgi:hypothetical protein
MPKEACAETREPLLPGQDVVELTFRTGVINQDGEFAPLSQSVRRLFASKEAAHRYTAPTFEYPMGQRRIP